jgi:cellulose biosynthesis protein BcsQ
MSKFDIMNKKIGVNILLWVVIIFVLLSFNQWNRNYQLQREISKIRKEHKKEIEEQIKERQKIIDRLEKENKIHKKEIEIMNHKIDSLDKIKGKIKIKYIERIEYIKSMDAEKIKNYWDEEFN